MSWKKHFNPVNALSNGTSSPVGSSSTAKAGPARTNYSSFLPDVYTGAPNRVDRYIQYDTMDMDSEVNAALDIIAEFCTQRNRENQTPFHLFFKNKATSTEIQILREYLHQWVKLQKFDTRIFRIIRNVFKYGDSIFIRDPETQEWNYVDPSKVVKVIVNESEGKKPEQYIIRDLSPNFDNLVVTAINPSTSTVNNRGTNFSAGSSAARGMTGSYPANPSSTASRFSNGDQEYPIDANHVVHLSLSEGLDNNFPFGTSLLENVFKVFKQKELLEDAIIIYRVQRAPERRVFYIDVGSLPPHLAMAYVERVKNEIQQRRIPTATGGGANIIDSTYNPMSINEDFYFPTTSEGRSSKVDTLPGGTNLGEINDLQFFTNKLFRGLRIPSSYLPTGADDSQGQFNDGRVGTAYIQELRFNNYCQRLQTLLQGVFDIEFKRFLYSKGVNIDFSLFDLQLEPPQNFASYRQAELDSQRAPLFAQMTSVPFLSKRFALKRFLGLTDEEIAENQQLWSEENARNQPQQATDSQNELRGAGISPGGMTSDMAPIENIDDSNDSSLGADELEGLVGSSGVDSAAAPAPDAGITP